MTKKSGGDGGKPKGPRSRAPKKPAPAKKAENSKVINLSDVDREALKKRRRGAQGGDGVSRLPDRLPPTQAGARASGPAKKRGRPEHEPDADSRAKVAALAAIGVTKELIAIHIGIATETLRKHYAQELELGFEMTGMSIVTGITQKALAGDFKAQRLWLETHMGWGKRQQRNALPTHAVRAENIPELPSGPGAAPGPGGAPETPKLPVNDQGDYVVEMKLGLDDKSIKEDAE